MTDSKVNVTGFHVVLEITEYGTRVEPPVAMFGAPQRQETSRKLIALEVNVDTIAEVHDAVGRNVGALPYYRDDPMSDERPEGYLNG